MNFGLSESQQTLKNTARKFLAAECPIADVRRLAETETAHDETLWKKMAEQGWMGLLIPEEYGGFGMSMVEMAVVLEEMGRALVPGPYFSTVLLAGVAIERAGSDTQKRDLLARLASGEVKATLALLEASGSWLPGDVEFHASPVARGYHLRGHKMFVPDAGVADLIVLAARLDGDLALFAVDSKIHGVVVRPMPSMDNTRKLYEIMVEPMELPASSLLAKGERAQRAIEAALDAGAAGLAAEMTGGMQRVLEISVEYAKTRKQFGKPIGSFMAVQHLCADIFLYTEGARSASYYAAWALSENDPGAAAAVSVAKAYASDGFRESGNRGIQVHGGMGFTWENDLHLYYRRAKASEIACGDANFHRERVARMVVDGAPVAAEEPVRADV
jgi:alkylation response protein AidB-like acyl-CoA dehydrogenase